MKNTLDFVRHKLTSPLWILLFVTTFTIAYFIFAHEGFYWIDDYGYAKYAWEVLNGKFSVFQHSEDHPNNPLTHRIGTFGPVALFFWLFGINIYAATLWPLLCTIGCAVILFLLFRKDQPLVAVFSMILLGLYYHTLFLATYLYPDNLLMFFAFAAVAVLYRFRYLVAGQKPVWYAFLFVVVNFMAYLVKESILFYFPFYLYLLVTDLFQKKHFIFWRWAFGFGVIAACIYLGYYYLFSGHPLYRFQIYEKANIDDDFETTASLPFSHFLPRLTYYPLLFFIGSGIIIPFVFALGLLRRERFSEILLIKKPPFFWLVLAFSVLLFLWFGTTAFSFYNPLPLLPRFFTPFMPPLCICAAYGIGKFLEKDRVLAIVFTLAFLAVVLTDRSSTSVMYLPLFLFMAGACWLIVVKKKALPPAFLALVLLGALSIRPAYFMQKPTLMAFQEEHKIVSRYLNDTEGKNLVITDKWLANIADFHYGFEQNPHYVYQDFSAPADFSKFSQVFLVINQSALTNPEMINWLDTREKELHEKFAEKQLVAREGTVWLYKLK